MKLLWKVVQCAPPEIFLAKGNKRPVQAAEVLFPNLALIIMFPVAYLKIFGTL